MSPSVDFQSLRAKKARFSLRFSGVMAFCAGILAIAFGLGGAVLLMESNSWAWTVFGLAALPVVVLMWRNHDLKKLPIAQRPQAIDDVLSPELLGRLKPGMTPQQIAGIVGSVRGGQFMAARVGLSVNVLQNLASERAEDTEVLWRSALTIRDRTESQEITGAVMAAAFFAAHEQGEAILRQFRLEMSDVEAAIRWYERIKLLIEQSKVKPMHTGGIARDWSFGYTPLLQRFAQNLSQQVGGGMITTKLDAHQDVLEQMMNTFHSGGRQNIALVGPDGAGKSTLVASFAERLINGGAAVPRELLYQQVFLLDASSLISVASGRGELENLVTQILNEAYRSKNIIICLDNAQLFFEEGVGSVDLTNLLLPILEAGRLRIILTIDEQRYLQIAQRSSGLVNALNRLAVPPTTPEETMAVMRDQVLLFEMHNKVTYMYQSMPEAYRIGDRYIQGLEMPGKALKLLESAALYAENGLVTQTSVDNAVEKTLNIKVAQASDADEKETLLNLEQLIHERMINQTRAVSVVSDAIRRARAGVRNQNRPIGTFLFLGPTGVGKTELSKALASVYFNGEDRMIRLDLNEFVQPEDVSRLIADGARDAGSLTAQVQKQPFSVVLLDEIEKAHPQVLTTLLQLLDEGVLRDENNREISFRDTIVIATSNAGADRIREYIERGYQLEQFESQFIDELISANLFRPEFLNRFDEIVVFRPLSKDELLQVVDLILSGINKTLAPQKITVEVEQAGKIMLVDAGYDPRMGARPMRRVVQRAVENTIARLMLSNQAGPGSHIVISAEMIQAALGANTPPAQTPPSPPTVPPVESGM